MWPSEEGERDLVIMRNLVGVEWQDGSQTHEEVGLTVYGEPYGLSAMAKTVGYPAAIGAKMILDGKQMVLTKPDYEITVLIRDEYNYILQLWLELQLYRLQIFTYKYNYNYFAFNVSYNYNYFCQLQLHYNFYF